MKKLTDSLEHYYKNMDCNCAEAMFRSAREAWGLDISDDVSKAMAGFGGGMGVGSVCGGVTAGVAALSCKYVNGNGHNSPILMSKVRLFINLVRERMGDDMCSVLKPKYITQEEKCLPTIRLIAEILEEIDRQ
jgi:C_GCAxxG_C_C family probable redox protein